MLGIYLKERDAYEQKYAQTNRGFCGFYPAFNAGFFFFWGRLSGFCAGRRDGLGAAGGIPI